MRDFLAAADRCVAHFEKPLTRTGDDIIGDAGDAVGASRLWHDTERGLQTMVRGRLSRSEKRL